MESGFREIKFKGKDYILVCQGEEDKHGAITTIERFKKGHVSYAHIQPDDNVWCFGSIIGNTEDIEYGKPINLFMDAEAQILAMKNMLGNIVEFASKGTKDRN